MRIQSTHDFSARGLDAYFTCREAVESLILLEGGRLPRRLWEPCCGDGAIVHPLRQSGRFVVASDIYDYGLPGCQICNYLTAPLPLRIEGLITNPPFQAAQRFAQKAISEVPYVALLVRTNFLMDGAQRGKWLDGCEPTRVWLSAQRLPFMHRYNWAGKRSTTNTPHCWAVWERGAPREFPQRFYWRELLGAAPARRRKAA